jgi:hypothetical protein
VNLYLTLLPLIIASTIAAWVVRRRMRRRIKMALGSKPATEVELTSLRTWMRVDEREERIGEHDTPEENQYPQEAVLLTKTQLISPAQDPHSPAREGRRLVLPLRSGLPPFCLKCGEPATTYKEMTLSWFPQAGELVYLFVGILVVRKVTVFLPLCSTHRWHRLALKVAGVLLLLAAIPLGILVGDDMGAGISLGLVITLLTFTTGVFMWWRSEVLHIKQLNDDEMVFSGACEEFLNILPLRHKLGT